VDRHPWCAVAHTVLGGAYSDQGDVARAERALSASVRLSGMMPEAHRLLAEIDAQGGRDQDAERETLALVPGDVDAVQPISGRQGAHGP